MRIPRPHPIVTGIVSTLLVALACAMILLWGFATPASPHSAPAPHSHTATVTAAAHHDRAPAPIVQRCIPYPAANPDPAQNCADLYLPGDYQQRTGVPVVALVHGGSWARGVTARSFDRVARDLTARGVAVYNVEYRRVGTGGGWPTTFTDVGAALDNLPAVIARHRQLTLQDSVLVGHSAGAQLAVWDALRTAAGPGPELSAPRWTPTTVVSVAGPLDMRWAADHGDSRVVRVLGGTPSTVPGRYRAVDPLAVLQTTATPATGPRIIAVHGTSDHLVSMINSERFVAEYLLRGGRAELRLLPGQTHTSMFRSSSPAYRALLATIVDAAHGSR